MLATHGSVDAIRVEFFEYVAVVVTTALANLKVGNSATTHPLIECADGDL